MFYSEYRPKKFSDLIGIDNVVNSITKSLAANATAHAFFFTGSRGTGKTSTARLLAKALNCQNPIIIEHNDLHPHIHFEPCGECPSCVAIQKGSHLDLIEIDAASNRGIDDVRVLRENINLSPTMGVKKVYIIDEVHMLTNEASNALLKTLEEPPKHVFFILCTTNPEKVIDTIKSRCIQVSFKKPDISSLMQKLSIIAKDKNLNLNESDLLKISKLAKGAFRDAETFLEQISLGDLDIDQLFGSEYDFYSFTSALLNKNSKSAIEQIHSFFQNQSNIESWVEKYIEYLRYLLFANIGMSVENLSKDDVALSKSVGVLVIKNILKRFNEVPLSFKSSVYPTLPIELAIIDVVSGIDPQNAEKKVEIHSVPSPTADKPVMVSPVVEKLEKTVHQNPKEVIEDKTIKNLSEVPVQAQANSKRMMEFKYKDLVLSLKEDNHSVYLLLSSCGLQSFDGKYLTIRANYSFHKERIMSNKIREAIESSATKMHGSPVVVLCEIDKKNKDADRLTDQNIVVPQKAKIEDVFQNVFGEELENVTEK